MDFNEFYKQSSIIEDIAKLIRSEDDTKLVIEILKKNYESVSKEIDYIYEAWYNPMDWMRGAGRYAATSFAGKPDIQHIRQLFGSLQNVIHRSGHERDFRDVLQHMRTKIASLTPSRNQAARAAEIQPASNRDPSAGGVPQSADDAKNPNVPSAHPEPGRTTPADENPEPEYQPEKMSRPKTPPAEWEPLYPQKGSQAEKNMLRKMSMQDVAKYQRQRYGLYAAHNVEKGPILKG